MGAHSVETRVRRHWEHSAAVVGRQARGTRQQALGLERETGSQESPQWVGFGH